MTISHVVMVIESAIIIRLTHMVVISNLLHQINMLEYFARLRLGNYSVCTFAVEHLRRTINAKVHEINQLNRKHEPTASNDAMN